MEARLCRVQKRFDRMNANLERAGSRLERIQVRLDRRHSPFAEFIAALRRAIAGGRPSN